MWGGATSVPGAHASITYILSKFVVMYSCCLIIMALHARQAVHSHQQHRILVKQVSAAAHAGGSAAWLMQPTTTTAAAAAAVVAAATVFLGPEQRACRQPQASTCCCGQWLAVSKCCLCSATTCLWPFKFLCDMQLTFVVALAPICQQPGPLPGLSLLTITKAAPGPTCVFITLMKGFVLGEGGGLLQDGLFAAFYRVV